MQSDQLRLMARELAEMVKKMPKLDWTQRLGDAFLADEASVMQTVQGLRARAQQAGQITHMRVGQRRVRCHHQHPRRIARSRRAQRDTLCRQGDIEQVYTQPGAL